jgi:general stress protein YciG
MADDTDNENNVTVTKRGFAAMDPEKRREIARKGGAAVSQNRDHMASIGRKGGEARSRNRGGGTGTGIE